MKRITLLEFIDDPKCKDVCRWKTGRKNLRYAVRKFSAFLGHPATIDDVTDERLTEFRLALHETTTPISAAALTYRVRSVAQRMAPECFARRKGCAKWPDKDRAEKYPGTLRALLESDAAANLVKSYGAQSARSILKRFARFMGHEVRPDEISDELLTGFCGYERGRGISAHGAGTAASLVRSIAKLARPDLPARKSDIKRPGYRNKLGALAMSNAPPDRMLPDEVKALAKPETLLEDAYWHVYYPRHAIRTAKSTQRLYIYCIDRLSQYLGRKATLGDFNDETVSGWLGWIMQEGITPQTVNCRRTHLLSFWRFLARKRFVDEWPDISAVPEPSPLPTAWTQEQFCALLDACKNYTGPGFAGVNGAGWFYAFHLVAYDTGERCGALLALQWDWLDPATGDLAVPAGVRKGRQKPMLYKLQRDTLDALVTIRQPQRELIFPLGCDLGTFYNRGKQILMAAGLPHGRRDRTHRIRRTMASHLEAAGGNATSALAHSSRKVTECYLDERIINRQRPSDLLPRPWADKPEAGKAGVA